MKLAKREQLLSRAESRYAEEEIESFGNVRCKSLNALEAAELNIGNMVDGAFSQDKYKTYKLRVIVRCLVDETGHRLYSDDDVAAIGSQDAQLVDKIYEVCERHINGDVVTAKNLSETNGEDSRSD